MPSPNESLASDPAPASVRPRRHRWVLAVAVVAVGLVVAFVVGLTTFTHAHRTVLVGAHSGTVTPTFDGHATLDFGSVLPRIRMAVDQPFDLGVSIDLGETEADSLNELVARDAVIASRRPRSRRSVPWCATSPSPRRCVGSVPGSQWRS